MPSNLWLPDDVEDLLLLTVDPQESGDSEFNTMLALNLAAQDWLSGKLSTGDYMDILECAEIDPVWFIESAETHVERLIQTL